MIIRTLYAVPLSSSQNSTKLAQKLGGLNKLFFLFCLTQQTTGKTFTVRLLYLRRKFVPTYNLKIKQLFNSNSMKEVYICTVLIEYSVGGFLTAHNEHQLFLLPTSVFPTTSLALGYWDLRATNSLRVVGWIHITRSPLKHSCFCCLLF